MQAGIQTGSRASNSAAQATSRSSIGPEVATMRNWPASDSRFAVEPSSSGLVTGPSQPEAPSSAALRVARSNSEPDFFLSHSTSSCLKHPVDGSEPSLFQKISSSGILANVFSLE